MRPHSSSPSAVTTPTSSFPSSGRASSNTSTPPKSSPTFPNRMQLALPLYQGKAVDRDLGAKRFQAHVVGAASDVRDAPEPLLHAPVSRISNHRRVEAGAGHDREPLTVEAADVQPAALASKSDRDSLLDVLGDPEIGREEVRRSRGNDRERDRRTGENVNAALDHSVPAPGEDQLRALVEGTFDPRRELSGSSAPRTTAGRRLPRSRGRDEARGGHPRASCRSGQ